MTNVELIKAYNKDLKAQGLDIVLDTYQGWSEKGYQVKRGEKSYDSIMGRGCKIYGKRKAYFDKRIYLFSNEQVKDADGNPFIIPQAEPVKVDDEGFMTL